MKPIVIGGTGFVGMNLVRLLVRQGYEVTATRRVRANTLIARKLGAKLVRAELDDVDSLIEAMRGCDVVFHCAGYYPRYSLDIQSQVDRALGATDNVLQAMRRSGAQRLVFTSSVATVGPSRTGKPLSDEDDPMDRRAEKSVYYRIKQVMEKRVMDATDIDRVVLCPSGIIGELDVKVGTGFGIVALAHGKLPYYVQGKTSVVDADDVAQAHLAAALRGKTAERYIVTGANVTMKAFLQAICDELGVRFFSWPIPLWLAAPLATVEEYRCSVVGKGERPFIPREFVDLVRYGQWYDSTKATTQLGLSEPTTLQAMIAKACAWFKRFHYIPQDAIHPGASHPTVRGGGRLSSATGTSMNTQLDAKSDIQVRG